MNVAQQYGIGYLPLMLMEEQKLIEKHAKAAGLDVKVNWAKFAGGNVMNDALLSGSLQFASGGVGRSSRSGRVRKGNLDVKAVAALNSMPLYLNTRNPEVNSIKDFTEKDKIALPAVKVSIQAIMLQMAAEKAFGEGNQTSSTRSPSRCRIPMRRWRCCPAVRDHRPLRLAAVPVSAARAAGHPHGVQLVRHARRPATFNLVWTTRSFTTRTRSSTRLSSRPRRGDGEINKDKRAAAETYLVCRRTRTTSRHPGVLNDPASSSRPRRRT